MNDVDDDDLFIGANQIDKIMKLSGWSIAQSK